jgi:hypothetical protein
MGAIEFLATKVESTANRTSDAGNAIAGAIGELAATIKESIGPRMTDAADAIVGGIEDAMNRNRRPTDTEQEGK